MCRADTIFRQAVLRLADDPVDDEARADAEADRITEEVDAWRKEVV
ncbi:hypothetical protein ODZ83_05430 [Acaricomes phytoseiuli]|nr:hypothetical protein [Acaricomes phytoseiuli]MCW1249632.1 hypothetical protein [Acaricomes phytoseiuli]